MVLTVTVDNQVTESFILQIHSCCGCSCHVCAEGHQAGHHTDECCDRFMEDALTKKKND